MKTQFDSNKRVVSVENLKAMCAHVSGMCHTYKVTSVSRSRVHVTYSNPDEYGQDHPMTAVYPCYPSNAPANRDDADNPCVVLDILRVLNDNWDGEGWQAFDLLHDCPTLWRVPHTGKWRSHRQLRKDGDDRNVHSDTDTCTVCDLPEAS